MGFEDYLQERERKEYDVDKLFEAMAIGELIKDGDTKMSRMRAVQIIKKGINKLYYGLHMADPKMKPFDIFYAMTLALSVKEPDAIKDLYMGLDKDARGSIEDDARARGFKIDGKMTARNASLKDDSIAERRLKKGKIKKEKEEE